MNEQKQVMLDWSVEEWSNLLEALSGAIWSVDRSLMFVDALGEKKKQDSLILLEKRKKAFIQMDILCPYDEAELIPSDYVVIYRKKYAAEYPPKEDKKRFKVEL